MSFPSNERLFRLYECVADQLTKEQTEILLRRAGADPTGQEIKDVRHRIRQVIQAYVDGNRSTTSEDS